MSDSESEAVCDAEDFSNGSLFELSQSQSQSQGLDSSVDQDSGPFQNKEVEDLEPGVKTERLIVDKPLLMKLFQVCSEPSCGALIDPEEVKISEVGAAVTIHATCLNNHNTNWSSSDAVGEGHKKTFTINILLACYTLFCGLNISQVTEYFGHLGISCIGRSFFFNLQSNLLHNIVWMTFCYSQV
eukprot:GFUD01139746.1.p1 GENE.GFUD01139746.1~~GFUD01139746.1.p1  ORF type:complete len:185 (-),score=33.68 GFUD01139746.1:98-652(-)